MEALEKLVRLKAHGAPMNYSRRLPRPLRLPMEAGADPDDLKDLAATVAAAAAAC